MREDGRFIIDIINRLIAPPLIGSDALDLEALHQRMDRTLYGNGAAKAAIDIGPFLHQEEIIDPVFELAGGGSNR